jgi:hypothetical protein
MATAITYDQIYGMVRNGYTGDSTIWDKTYEYIRLHPNELFLVAPPRRWSIGHQILYHGGLKLFKRLLSLYNEKTPINIFSETKDTPPLTILDIANERKSYYKEQYEYIERLFAQDKFIQACKANNWPAIDEMLNKDRQLLNEKPPYYSNYFIHYLVRFGDVRSFDQYNFPDHPLKLDLQNDDGKTALDLARELKNHALINHIQRLLPLPRSTLSTISNDRDERDEDRRTPSPSNQGPYVVPVPLKLTPEISKKITCTLTKKTFVDPVIASDGQTYERKAIIEYFRDNRYSPLTGESMDDTYIDNLEMKNLIRELRQKKLIP